jgi:hypothetical protein
MPDIRVKYACGAYGTNACRGVTSSSTSSAQAAAERQALRLYGADVEVVQVPGLHLPVGHSHWRVLATLPAEKVSGTP